MNVKTDIAARPAVPENLQNIKSVRILYNPYNIDCVYAVCLIAERLRQHNKDIQLQVVTYDFGDYQKADREVDVLITCAGYISSKDMFQEIERTRAHTVMHFNYEQSKPQEMKLTSGIDYKEITPHWQALEEKKLHGDDKDHIYSDHVAENSIAVVANDYLYRLGFGGELTTEQKRLMMVISSYINFAQFNSIFVKADQERDKTDTIKEGRIVRRTENDLVFLYQNMQGIRDYAARGAAYPVIMSGQEDPYEFRKELTTIRRLISRNMTEEIYSHRTKLAKIQTTCVGEESAVEVMRQLSYAFATIITYEDIQNFRIWRILSSDEGILGMLREALEPVVEWQDCRIIYFASDLPKRERK